MMTYIAIIHMYIYTDTEVCTALVSCTVSWKLIIIMSTASEQEGLAIRITASSGDCFVRRGLVDM